MKRAIATVILCLAAALSAGCDRAAPVAARVNGAEISALQLRVSSPAEAGALEKVIDRELLVQQAIRAGLDRNPDVREAIDAARRRILAEAWLDKLAASSRVSREEIHAFYAENPSLFAERRVYRLRELTVAAPAELLEVLRAEASRARDLEEIAAWLRQRDARFSISAASLPAEQVPLGQLPRLAQMKGGEIAVFPVPAVAGAPGGAAVVQLVQAQAAPLSELESAPMIETFLAGRKRLELAAAEVKQLRQEARIEYAGDLKDQRAR